ncbi:MAG TPA: archaeosortase/exosortase family protein [Polyangia bacterium]
MAIAGALFALYAFPYQESGLSERWFQSYLQGYAHLAGRLLAVVDRQVTIDGNLIAGRYALRIVKTCDAMEANLLFLAAILAFPAPWRRKMVALVAGLIVLVLANVLRICSLYFVGVHAPGAFETVHVEIWPLLMIVVAGAQFAWWARWTRRTPSLSAAGSASS